MVYLVFSKRGWTLEICLRLIGLEVEELAESFSEAGGCIISGGEHEAIEKVLNGEDVTLPQLCRGTPDVRAELRDPDGCFLRVYFEFFEDLVAEVEGHLFGETRDLPPKMLVLARDEFVRCCVHEHPAFGADFRELLHLYLLFEIGLQLVQVQVENVPSDLNLLRGSLLRYGFGFL